MLVIFIIYLDDIQLIGRRAALVKNNKLGLIARYFMADLFKAGLLLNMTATRGYDRAILERYSTLKCYAVHKSHSKLDGKTPYAMIHVKEAGLSIFRAIRARAFVNSRRCKTKFDDRPWGQTLRLRMGQQDIPHLQPHHLRGYREKAFNAYGDAGLLANYAGRTVASRRDGEHRLCDRGIHVYVSPKQRTYSSIAESEAQNKNFVSSTGGAEAQRTTSNTAGYNECKRLGRWGRTDKANAEYPE